MVPVLIIDGVIVATGSARDIGTSETLTIEFYHPTFTTTIVEDVFIYGSLHALMFNPGKVSLSQLEKKTQELLLFDNQTFSETALSQLHLLGLFWSYEMNFFGFQSLLDS